jgi:hypothetical protein
MIWKVFDCYCLASGETRISFLVHRVNVCREIDPTAECQGMREVVLAGDDVRNCSVRFSPV